MFRESSKKVQTGGAISLYAVMAVHLADLAARNNAKLGKIEKWQKSALKTATPSQRDVVKGNQIRETLSEHIYGM